MRRLKINPKLTATLVLSASLLSVQGATAWGDSGPSAAPAVVASEAAPSSAHGKEVFQALYFGVGPVVKKIQTRLGNSSYNTFVELASSNKNQVRVANQMVSLLEKKDGTTFLRFDAAVRSGDPVRFEAAAKDLRTKMTNGAIQLTTTNQSRVDPDVTGRCFAAWVAVAAAGVYLSVGAFQIAFVLAQGAVFTEAWAWWSSPGQATANDSLTTSRGLANVSRVVAGI